VIGQAAIASSLDLASAGARSAARRGCPPLTRHGPSPPRRRRVGPSGRRLPRRAARRQPPALLADYQLVGLASSSRRWLLVALAAAVGLDRYTVSLWPRRGRPAIWSAGWARSTVGARRSRTGAIIRLETPRQSLFQRRLGHAHADLPTTAAGRQAYRNLRTSARAEALAVMNAATPPTVISPVLVSQVTNPRAPCPTLTAHARFGAIGGLALSKGSDPVRSSNAVTSRTPHRHMRPESLKQLVPDGGEGAKPARPTSTPLGDHPQSEVGRQLRRPARENGQIDWVGAAFAPQACRRTDLSSLRMVAGSRLR